MGGPLIALRPGPARRLCLSSHRWPLTVTLAPPAPARAPLWRDEWPGQRAGEGSAILVSSASQAREGLALEQGAGLSKAAGPARTGLPPLLRPQPCPGMFPPQEQEGVRLCRRPPPCRGLACVPQGPVLKLKPQRLRCGCIWRHSLLKR